MNSTHNTTNRGALEDSGSIDLKQAKGALVRITGQVVNLQILIPPCGIQLPR